MPYRRHSRSRYLKPGLAEVLLVVALVIGFIPATLWWMDSNKPAWRETGAWVVTGDLQETHYNAQEMTTKAHVVYEYLVGAVRYRGEFLGIWPMIQSPNALMPAEMTRLTEPGYNLTVYYNPLDPEQSNLHRSGSGLHLSYLILTVAGFLLCGAYCFVLYPNWRFQSQRR